jgi:hypothetical protein
MTKSLEDIQLFLDMKHRMFGQAARSKKQEARSKKQQVTSKKQKARS